MLGRNLGGIEQSFLDYLNAFEGLNHKSVGIISKNAQIKSRVSKNIALYSVMNICEWDFFSAIKIRKILQSVHADVVIVHGRRAARLVEMAGVKVPVIGVAHNYEFKHLLNLAHIFCVSQDIQHALAEEGYKKENTSRVPNMIDVSEVVSKKTPPSKFADPPIIGAMGRFVDKKGFHILLKALSILDDQGVKFKCVIAGDGEERGKLKKLTEDLGLKKQVKFSGWVANKESFFSSIDIFCLPSTNEPFGIVLLEAMLSAKPIVSFMSQGPAEIGIDKQTLLFAQNGNERELANKLHELLENEKLANKLSSNAKDYVIKNYNIKVIAQLLNKQVEKVLKEQGVFEGA